MESSYQFLLTIGGILLLGLVVSTVARRTFLPRVTLLLIFGVIIGPEVLDMIPVVFAQRFDLIADMTLLMVGFILGGKLTRISFADTASKSFWISISAALATTLFVTIGLIFVGVSIEVSIILGCIASATAPAAVLDVITEMKAKGKFSSLLISIVALDDIWALMLFGIGMSIVNSLNGNGGDTNFLFSAATEIGGAILLGIIIGLPAAYLTGRVKPGQPILSEAVSIVFLCGGLAIWLNVSYLIAAMSMGIVVTNLAKHHEYPFHAIEGIEEPFMVVFFVLAGASLETSHLLEIGLIGVIYILCRAIGKYFGARIGGHCSKASSEVKHWMGTALLPQAGVAIGMALVASHQFPEYRQLLLSVVVGSTVFFEIVGPAITRMALKRVEQV